MHGAPNQKLKEELEKLSKEAAVYKIAIFDEFRLRRMIDLFDSVMKFIFRTARLEAKV